MAENGIKHETIDHSELTKRCWFKMFQSNKNNNNRRKGVWSLAEIDQSEQVLCEFIQLKDQLLNCKLSQIGLDLLCPSNLAVI